MKKYLIFSITFVVMAFMYVVNVSATSIGSQSIDVTVGEVDKIDNSDMEEEQDIHSPNTGVLGLEIGKASIMAAAVFAVPIAAIIAYLLNYIKSKRAKSGVQ